MNQMKTETVVHQVEMIATEGDADLRGEVVAHPEIMVAADIIDGNAMFDQIAKHEEDFVMILGNGVFVLEPKIKKIAHDK